MKLFLHAFAFAYLLIVPALAQVDCSNIGFEKGSTAGWVLTYGTVTDANQATVYQSEISGTSDHYVTSISDGNDAKIPSIPMVAPGSTHSIRIGNINEGSHYSRIHADYTVTADNTLFQYKFAVVLQNTSGTGGQANHEPYQKPGFNILIFDSNGEELPCSSYDIQLQGNNTVDGFQTSGDIQYRNWTTGAIDLRNFVGKTITIVVTAHGCTRMRHFGYAYFDAECLKSEIKTTSNCPDEEGFLTLAAPTGFGQYQWSNGASTQNVKVKASLGDKYHVDLTPLGSLEASCALGLDYTIAFRQSSAAIDSTICEGEQVALGDTIYRTSGTFIRNISKSNVCDSTVTLTLKVNPVSSFTQNIKICKGETLAVGDSLYAVSGNYINHIPKITGCDSTVITNLEVIQMDVSVTPTLSITQGDSVQIHALVEPSGSYHYLWSPSTLSCITCREPWASPPVSTVYTLQVTDSEQVCKQSAKVQVYVKPCGIYAPEAFSPNHDEQNEVFYVYGNKCVKLIRTMFIYSRWGEVIFQKENFAASDPASGWDGTYHGTLTAAGVYPYKIKVELTNGSFLDFSGVVNLLR
ncbi:T9SS type B sorting domain-containing protein [Dyadobacter pollutisoli]|uniref:Gliding motility-associated C-terminal domain-containing protein n=1 Tax=Dyadobacter pollutisoli TaxID=2910158 RepID=A0A9E8SNR1_9BACT|nr:gliding motility-associated C-terminal domain-containing protein [Dyadobacter pollutisoli]WAC13951.1 gliding motility-associated C-terminal domain-containing protein [Dyadobacter pollutisoli]